MLLEKVAGPLIESAVNGIVSLLRLAHRKFVGGAPPTDQDANDDVPSVDVEIDNSAKPRKRRKSKKKKTKEDKSSTSKKTRQKKKKR